IKNNMNVAGGGINLAQRVMDCGDGGHILLSKRVADDIGQLARWSPHLHDLGNAKVKHGVLVHVYNLYAEDFGNAAVPPKLQKRNGANRNLLLRIAVATIVLGIVGTALFYWYRSRASLAPAINVPTTTETASLGPERSLTYWLSYQKMRDGKIDSEPRQSAGNDIFGNGWRFQFNVTPNEPGALYLLNVGLDKKGEEQYNVLFPLPGVGQSDPNLKANQIFKSGWADFVDQTGVERIWIIWSQHPIVELNTIFTNAVRNEGVVRSADEIKTIQSYLDAGNSSVVNDKEKKQTVVKGRGEILVSVVELTHEAN
ncbi:MAG TPA: hypothetical protein VLB68_21355, partial [Pyrinomonadaceae bacterium]|nr:hypothetical protein [Pyrinomonadaceae bacterium]